MANHVRRDYLERVDFSDEAQRELLGLPTEVREPFFEAFSYLAGHPTRETSNPDIRHLHDARGRRTHYGRLKVPGGYRAIYRAVQGRVHIDAIRPRPGVYAWLSKLLGSD